jgi:hypothetical protein
MALRNSADAISAGAALGVAEGGGDATAAAVGAGEVCGETVGNGVPADGDVDLGWHHAIDSTINKRIPQMSAR